MPRRKEERRRGTDRASWKEIRFGLCFLSSSSLRVCDAGRGFCSTFIGLLDPYTYTHMHVCLSVSPMMNGRPNNITTLHWSLPHRNELRKDGRERNLDPDRLVIDLVTTFIKAL